MKRCRLKRYNFKIKNKMSKENEPLGKHENGNDFIADVSERFSPIDKKDPTFEILFRDGNWGAYDTQLTDMMREMVIRYNKLVEFLNAR